MPTIPGTYDELKRGRKTCPGCDNIIGAGRRKCPACQYTFGAANKEKNDAPVAIMSKHLIVPGTELENSTDVLVVPAGKCPCPLKSTEPAAVKQWMKDVAVAYVPTGKRERTALSIAALVWWAREFFPYGSTGHDQVQTILQAHVSPYFSA